MSNGVGYMLHYWFQLFDMRQVFACNSRSGSLIPSPPWGGEGQGEGSAAEPA